MHGSLKLYANEKMLCCFGIIFVHSDFWARGLPKAEAGARTKTKSISEEPG